MEVRVTSVLWTEAYSVAHEVCEFLEHFLTHYLPKTAYGSNIQILNLILISVDEGDANERFKKTRNRFGYNTDPIHKTRNRYISIAITIPASKIENIKSNKFTEIFINSLIKTLQIGEIKYPKGFDSQSFSHDLETVLAKIQIAE